MLRKFGQNGEEYLSMMARGTWTSARRILRRNWQRRDVCQDPGGVKTDVVEDRLKAMATCL